MVGGRRSAGWRWAGSVVGTWGGVFRRSGPVSVRTFVGWTGLRVEELNGEHGIMMRKGPLFRLVGCWMLLLGLGGCGFEGLLVDALTDEPVVEEPEDVDVPIGEMKVGLLEGIEGIPHIMLVDEKGEVLAEVEPDEEASAYGVPIDSSMGDRPLRLVAISGEYVLKGMICFSSEAVGEEEIAIDLDLGTTAAALVVEAGGAVFGLAGDKWSEKAVVLESYPGEQLMGAYDAVVTRLQSASEDKDEALYSFFQMVQALNQDGSPELDTPMFVPIPESSALLDDAFLALHNVDYDGDGQVDKDGALFDSAANELAWEALDDAADAVQPVYYTDPNGVSEDEEGNPYQYIRVIFTAHVHEGMQDGNCTDKSLCEGKGIVCDPGDTLYFTGGVHEDSPILDPEIDALLGAWIPNDPAMEMFDDGMTYGDVVAGDGIYTITFELPVGLRIGYKYTWGQSGDGWSGTEEWPGNSRILEIVDDNGDGYVWRDDTVTDEATNKDKQNCYGTSGCSSFVTWDTDLNGDGYLEAHEHPLAFDVEDQALGTVRLNGRCDYDDWVHPATIRPVSEGSCR